MSKPGDIETHLGDTEAGLNPSGARYDGSINPLDKVPTWREGATLAIALLFANDHDELYTPGGAVATRAQFVSYISAFYHTPETFSKLSTSEQDRIVRIIERKLLKRMKERGLKPMTHARVKAMEAEEIARTKLHQSLNLGWARKPLLLERPPQGGSLHHLIRYDNENNNGQLASVIHDKDLQSFVVENDWGKLVPKSKGEWRLPFEKICWEFRISGVRVMVVTVVHQGVSCMYMIYGKDKQWVADDYLYAIDQDGFKGSPHESTRIKVKDDAVEFYAVAAMVYANIRASCIMLDANVAEGAKVEPNPELVKRAVRDNVAPPRLHHVVRLLRRPNYKHRSRGNGESEGHRQRGHWRPGRWLHYDTQDSGQEKYVNDGGFWVSKSWQSWHFAGDPNNIIEKEYRL